MSPLIPSILLLFVLVLQAQAASPTREAVDDQSPLKMKREFSEKDLNDESKTKRAAAPQGCRWDEELGKAKCYTEDEGKLMKCLEDSKYCDNTFE